MRRALLARTCLALEIATGNATDGVHLLDEIYREGEEIEIATLLGHNSRCEQDSVALAHDDRARCLLGKFAGLEPVALPVQFKFVRNLSHVLSSASALPPRAKEHLQPSCMDGHYHEMQVQEGPLHAALPCALRLDVVADAELCDEFAVVVDVALLDIREKTTTLTDEHEQATARVVILLVDLDVLGELANALGEDCDLDLGGTRIVGILAKLLDELGLAFLGDCHVTSHPFMSGHRVWPAPLQYARS